MWRIDWLTYGRLVSLSRSCSPNHLGVVKNRALYGNVPSIRQGSLPETKRGYREDRMCQLPPVRSALKAIVATGCIWSSGVPDDLGVVPWTCICVESHAGDVSLVHCHTVGNLAAALESCFAESCSC